MNPIRIVRRFAIVLAGLVAPVVAGVLAGPAAFAMNVPPPGVGPQERLGPPPVHQAAVGMPGWQIALIAIGAALVAALLVVLYERTLAARQPVTSPGTKATEHSMSSR